MSLSDEDKKWIREQHQQMNADLLTELHKGRLRRNFASALGPP